MTEVEETINRIPLGLIDPDPQNVRSPDDPEAQLLAESIGRQGQLVPITVYAVGERFRILIGSRRHAALQLAGKTHALALIVPRPTDGEIAIDQGAENTARKDLETPEMVALVAKVQAGNPGMPGREIAQRLGRSEGEVSKCVKVGSCPVTMAALQAKTLTSLNEAYTVAKAAPEAKAGLIAMRVAGVPSHEITAKARKPRTAVEAVKVASIRTLLPSGVSIVARGEGLTLQRGFLTASVEQGERLLARILAAAGAAPVTDSEIAGVGAEFGRYLRRYRACFGQDRTARHFDTYCRGLLSDLPRKTVEPVAVASGTAVRTLQEFLTTAAWDHESARDLLQRHLAGVLADLPTDELGTVGVIDETSCRKKGDRTPGVQRQYLGCAGKVDNGIVTVHVGVTKGRFQALLDADLYLPKSWADDRTRCREAGVPDGVRYLPKWRVALDQLLRLDGNGVRFDWLTFDEGYGAAVPFLTALTLLRQKFVAEVPVNFSVRAAEGGAARRADAVLTADAARQGRRFRLTRRTLRPQVWRAVSAQVWVRGKAYRLVTAVNEATAEVKYFVTNAAAEPLSRVLAVAFRRATVEHSFRVAKSEAGLMHYEGRQYVGLVRHLTLALLVMGFVSAHTDRLRGEKPAGDDGAGVPGAEREVRRPVPSAARHTSAATHGRSHPLPPAAERAGRQVPQETAA